MTKNIIAYISISFFVLSLFAGYFFYQSQKEDVQKPIVAASPVVETKSQKFKSDSLGFEMSLIDNLEAQEKANGKVVIIGGKILIYELDTDPEKCTGVCSIFTKKEDTTINSIKTRALEGYWNELGTDNAQTFISYVIPRKDKYLVFMLQELPIDSLFVKGRTIGKIDNSEIEMFKKMIESVNLI